jgi:hypothetical protein
VDRSVAPAAYFIARIKHESKSFLLPKLPIFGLISLQFLNSSPFMRPFQHPYFLLRLNLSNCHPELLGSSLW